MKYHRHNSQNGRFGERTSSIIKTYNNDVILNGGHIHKKSTDMDMAKSFIFHTKEII